MVKTTLVIGSMLFACALVAVPQAFAATFDIEVSENGFSQTSITLNSGDTVSFVNTHMKASGNLEPHCISDPFAQPYTVESYWIIDNTDPTIGYTLYESQTFYDRCFTDFAPVSVIVGDGTSTTTTEETDINSAPEYTGTVTEVELQENLIEMTADLTSALSTIGSLQQQLDDANQIAANLQSEMVTLQNQVVDVTPYETQISSLTTERDQWKQTAENWYAIALEQVRIMVEVLGL
jgi:hypothetical protein